MRRQPRNSLPVQLDPKMGTGTDRLAQRLSWIGSLKPKKITNIKLIGLIDGHGLAGAMSVLSRNPEA